MSEAAVPSWSTWQVEENLWSSCEASEIGAWMVHFAHTYVEITVVFLHGRGSPFWFWHGSPTVWEPGSEPGLWSPTDKGFDPSFA